MKRNQILLVDDEPIILRTLTMALEARGYGVTVAGSGEEATNRLRERPFDLVITDLAMEGLDGIQVLDLAKQVDPDTSVIVLTGYCDVGSAVDALRLGADDYLSKPCDYEELLLRMARCLEKRDLKRKLKLYEDILPVCTICRKIRDDSGREPGTGPWLPLEEYLKRKAGVTVSHGCCPDCEDDCLGMGPRAKDGD